MLHRGNVAPRNGKLGSAAHLDQFHHLGRGQYGTAVAFCSRLLYSWILKNCVLSAYSGYDGGDCCECTCESTMPFSCGVGDDADYNCIDPSAPCVNDLVDAGTRTTVSVSANGYDTRPGEGSGDNGCMEDGCGPELTRDGISADVESRWSCSQAIVDGERLCQIDFTFEDPQDVVDVEVAFWKGDERDRTLEVRVTQALQWAGTLTLKIKRCLAISFEYVCYRIDAIDIPCLYERCLQY